MSEVFQGASDYELFIYTLPDQFPSIKRSTLTFVRLGSTLARVAGELQFDHGYRLVVLERLLYGRKPLVIDGYGYEVWRHGEKLYWYDSQAHPNEPRLNITHPHHKHVPPNIKHHRIPARDLTFSKPNLPFLIQEIEEILALESRE
jgi:hypothetical protein